MSVNVKFNNTEKLLSERDETVLLSNPQSGELTKVYYTGSISGDDPTLSTYFEFRNGTKYRMQITSTGITFAKEQSTPGWYTTIWKK